MNMKTTFENASLRLFAWLWMLAAAGTLSLTACTSEKAPAPVAQQTTEDQGHDHEGHDHAGHEGHEHGPHEGELIELGAGKFHAELLHDHDTHTTTVYLLGEDAKTAMAIDATELTVNVVVDSKPQQFQLPAAPEAGDAEGKSSKFALTDEALCTALDAAGAKARLNAVIEGDAYTGDVPSHGHEGHEH
jgi:hypothetical protein